MYFIGVDLSWRISPPKPEKTACVALSEGCEAADFALLTTDQEIVEFIRPYSKIGCIVGIDAPLVVPPDVKQRECERMLLSCGIAVFPGNRNWFKRAFGGVRGEILVVKLRKLNIPLLDKIESRDKRNALFEIYPYSSWKILFKSKTVPKYKNTSQERKISGLRELKDKLLGLDMLSKLKIKGELEKKLEADFSKLDSKALDNLGDLLDATIAAYTVFTYWHYGERRCVVLGDINKGYILTLADDRLKDVAQKRKF